MAKMKDHTELGLSFAEYGALLGTRAMLDRKVLVHTVETYPDDLGATHAFNMSVACRANAQCGSVGCIGGTMALIMKMTPRMAENYVGDAKGELNTLFFPPGLDTYNNITPKHAIKAIDNFLRDGAARWHDVLPAKLIENRGFTRTD